MYSPSLQLDGVAESRHAEFVAAIKHVFLSFVLKHVWILNHFRVPALRRNVNTSEIIHAQPSNSILGFGVANAVTRLPVRAVVGSSPLAVPHFENTVFLQD